jgi:hypothetical protein
MESRLNFVVTRVQVVEELQLQLFLEGDIVKTIGEEQLKQ